nr:RNA-dependent RNA polymerase [Southern tomato virus]
MAGVGGSAAGRVPNAANVPLTAKEKERTVMREIVEIGETFVELGIDKRYFQRTTYVSHMLLPNQYFKLLKQFKGKTAEELDLALGAAVAHGVLRSMRGITFKKFFDFLNWVKTKEGKDALGETMYAQKLEQKGRGDFSIAEVALLHCFETQRNDMLRDEKDVRLKAEEEIADLQRKIVKRREKLEEDLIATKSNYEPVSRYVGLSDYELNCKCWSLYQQFNPDKVTAGAKPTRKQVKEAFDMYAEFVAKTNRLEFLKHGNVKDELQAFINAKILGYEQLGDKGRVVILGVSWQQWVLRWIMKWNQRTRKRLLKNLPVGKLRRGKEMTPCRPLSEIIPMERLEEKRTLQYKLPPQLSRATEVEAEAVSLLYPNARIEVEVRPIGRDTRAIPFSRSRWEVGVRKVIGGGEVLNWDIDGNKYRGGGCFADAIKLLAGATQRPPQRLLEDCYTITTAREALGLPSDLAVPSGKGSCHVRNYNDDATSGPFLWSFGIKKKYGLDKLLQSLMEDIYCHYSISEATDRALPYFAARVGFRSKLLTMGEAVKKFTECAPMGRCVMMLDALEQFASAPLYNVLSKYTAERSRGQTSFRNTVVRASSDWMHFWDEVKEAAVCVELDWSKFDRERPSEDLDFMIKVICSWFRPKDEVEAKLLRGYGVCMRRALVERRLITDDGGVIHIDGMVPSGSLWTGWLDTALNILYIKSVLRSIDILEEEAVPKCAGDDNLTVFSKDPGDEVLEEMRVKLNDYFRAGIKKEDFIITRPPFHVRTFQAVFKEGTDLSKGTSKIMKKAYWREFEDELRIDQEKGLSHRWEYRFKGAPKFLSCYWLEDGRPIRPSHENLEKLLYPEGVHANIDDYIAAVLSMVVDNPFNHHNINHLKHRYIIANQVKRLSAAGGRCEDILRLARIREREDEEVPVPQIAVWRRVKEYVDLDSYEPAKYYIQDFNAFVSGVTSLYARSSTGGLDAYKVMDLIRGNATIGRGQWGNDVMDWIRFVRDHPATKYLKGAKRFREQHNQEPTTAKPSKDARRAIKLLRNSLINEAYADSNSFAISISERLRRKKPTR